MPSGNFESLPLFNYVLHAYPLSTLPLTGKCFCKQRNLISRDFRRFLYDDAPPSHSEIQGQAGNDVLFVMLLTFCRCLMPAVTLVNVICKLILNINMYLFIIVDV